jgi:hypothetical protein
MRLQEDDTMLLGTYDLGTLVLEVLAVVGGATVGGLGSGLLLRLLVRLTVHQSVPRKVVVPVQLLGAVAAGILVWWLAFGAKGSGFGWGGGGGGWLGGFGGTEKETKPESTAPEEQKPEPSPPQKEEVVPAGAEVVSVEVLGGERVQAERFYLLANDPQPKTLAELREFIQLRQRAEAKPPLHGIAIVFNENSVARNHPAVIALERFAGQNGLAVTFTKGNPR